MKVGTLLAGYPIAYHIANLDLGSIFGLFSDLQTGTRDPLNRLASYVFHFALPYLINDSELRVSRAYLYVFLQINILVLCWFTFRLKEAKYIILISLSLGSETVA